VIRDHGSFPVQFSIQEKSKMKPWPGLSKHVLPQLPSIVLLAGLLIMGTYAQSSERSYKISQTEFPENVIKIVEVRNLNSEQFPEDFEVEIENISGQPIYAIHFMVAFLNSPFGMDLSYGRHKMIELQEMAQEGDKAIPPGGRAVLVPQAAVGKGTREAIAAGRMTDHDTKNLKLIFQVVNFGDGSGYLLKGFRRAKN
jgi:hypothetical protein